MVGGRELFRGPIARPAQANSASLWQPCSSQGNVANLLVWNRPTARSANGNASATTGTVRNEE